MKDGPGRRWFLDRMSALTRGAAVAWLSVGAARCAPAGVRRAVCEDGYIVVTGRAR